MNKPNDPRTESRGSAAPGAQRDMLEKAEERASEDQPKSFDERNLTEKVVAIPPKETTKQPIRGLDPQQGGAKSGDRGTQ